MITEMLLIILVIMSFGLLIYSHTFREVDKVIDDE